MLNASYTLFIIILVRTATNFSYVEGILKENDDL